jgi:lysophospholipase L1-like esterase
VKLTRRKSFLINLVLMVGSFACCLAGLETGAWFWEWGQSQGPYAWELVASRRIRLDRFETSGAGYTLMHPGEEYEWQSIPVRINSQGLRGPEVNLKKPPGTYRVLNLGDSVVFGWGVRYDDTYGYRLQELLNQHYGGDPVTYEVINAGVPGWNMANILAYLEAKGLDYQPDLILLNFTVVNDVYGRSALSDSTESLVNWLRDHTYAWPFLSVQYHLLEVRLGQQGAIPVLNPPADSTAYFPTREDDPQWDLVWEPIQDIATLADEHGSEFLLIVLPTAFQVQDAAYPEVPQQVLARRGREDGIQVLDLLPIFREACQEAPPGESCGPEGRYLWAEMWMHPSTLGHRLMAERVLDLLDEEGLH